MSLGRKRRRYRCRWPITRMEELQKEGTCSPQFAGVWRHFDYVCWNIICFVVSVSQILKGLARWSCVSINPHKAQKGMSCCGQDLISLFWWQNDGLGGRGCSPRSPLCVTRSSTPIPPMCKSHDQHEKPSNSFFNGTFFFVDVPSDR